MSLVHFIKNNSILSKSEELLFFGGSFNPWHAGHSSCIELAPKDWPIIVIPDHNPFKDLTSQTDKLTSLADIQNELQKVKTITYLFDGFLKSDKKNPSHQWIDEVYKAFPNKKVSLLMGFDTYVSIDKWISAKKVLKQLHCLYIASRLDDEEIKLKQFNTLRSINPKLHVKFLGNHDYEELSSTKIRESLNQIDQ